MKAVLMHEFGDSDVLYIGETETPQVGDGELLVRVRATALNRADLLQRMGYYPPPKGASEIIGLEMAGEIVDVGGGVTGYRVGDRVCALLPGGGYAQYAVIPADMAMPLPENLSFEQGAAIPEVFLTAYLNLVQLGGFQSGMDVLIHAGASGVGTAAIQLVRELGGRSLVTAGSPDKLARCSELGAAAGWNYKSGSFVAFVDEQTEGRGVDIILDFVGAPYLADNLKSLAMDGRVVIIGTMGGAKASEVDLGTILARRLQVIGTALRSRSAKQKAALTRAFWDFAFPRFSDGRLMPVIDTVMDWNDVKAAHDRMAANQNTGKIVLRVSD
ncbi:NAD(P)H-quinone oxidoreductase [Alicyclobacillus curvatus]|nr:NAD(P)H-quinone oxidoreductase [Alicyclobacillus curvatus]